MEVYKICREKFSNQLTASGVANRWNKEDEFVNYTAGSISLAALENIAHRASIDIANPYKLLKIKLTPKASVKSIAITELPEDWRSLNAYIDLQELGSAWYKSNEACVLKVPSAIVAQEFNYIINTKHPLFSSDVEIINVEDWIWDKRLL
jgi:RES domain-containing protein